MSDLISRQAVIELVKNSYYNLAENMDDVWAMVKDVEQIPSADRPTGEWIDADGNKVRLDADGHPLDSCWCSNCGEWLVASDEYEVVGKFCPHCGARMHKGGDSK